MNEQWRQQMRQTMAGYKYPAPEVSWEEIDRILTVNQQHKSRLLWLRRMAAAAVVLLIAGAGYWALLPEETEHVVDQPLTQAQPSATAADKPSQVTFAETTHNFTETSHKTATSNGSSSETTTASVEVMDTIRTEEPAKAEQAQTADKKEKPTPQKPTVVYPAEIRRQRHLDNRLTAQVYMSSTMSGSQTGGVNTTGFSPYIGVEELNHEVHHHQPIRFGLSLRYRLDDRWSLESGLSYTRLSSDIITTADGVTKITEQRLNYIGLPMTVSYDLWKSRRFGLYVSAGGMIEKQLEGSPWQFSLNGAAGAEYRLTDLLSLYAEPGFGYYFKDGSSTPTIYKDHPLNFNLSFGLRFNLK